MQLLIQVVCKAGKSLREAISTDKSIGDFQLVVSQQHKADRAKGWSKLHSETADGAINIEWQSNCNLLLARVVTKGAGNNSQITGQFVEYLLKRFSRRVQSINVISPR